MADEKTITIRKDDLWKYSTFILLAAIVVVLIVMFTGGNGSSTGNTVVPTQGADKPAIVRVSIDDDAMIGNPNAPVTIIEFSDYQCPFCRRHWTDTYSQIKADYIDTGKVNLVFRDLPLESIHPQAQGSAEAAECVREQGGDEAYFEYHDKIFLEQNLRDGGTPQGPVTTTISYTVDDLESWASDLGYDIGSCLSSGKYGVEVRKDIQDALEAGFQGTPGFVVLESGHEEGVAIRGALPYSEFKKVIDSMLN